MPFPSLVSAAAAEFVLTFMKKLKKSQAGIPYFNACQLEFYRN